ncbi:hypothetical protein [Methanococcus maripaludis]|uniref:Uncharacterized protein n=1 Tax=Methanococcus maripaludis TaxID=39152 RepID=A0A2L1C914_METMI|nr:hypothetical protein [Methanococcus maripaludis]AVB75872.1 hypothetical protein MMJJ_04550 [Methanococcus maripaludis]MBA2864289.1 hypothetical protein [Methanococcus maripaludis]MBB6497215.1 hypothetical protein [Methanococcus maripaludis]
MGLWSKIKDTSLNIATVGLYGLGKKIGNAASTAEEAAAEAAIALASIGITVQEVGEQLESLLHETEKLIVIKRLIPRETDDLWDEEKERLEELQAELSEIEEKMQNLGVDSSDYNFGSNFSDFFNFDRIHEIMDLVLRRYRLKKEIYEILYTEPGIISESIYNINESIERFNTLEQPKIENIMDSVDENLLKTEELLEEVKKLFVVNKKEEELKLKLPWYNYKIEKLKSDKEYFSERFGKKELQIQKFEERLKPNFEIDIEVVNPPDVILKTDVQKEDSINLNEKAIEKTELLENINVQKTSKTNVATQNVPKVISASTYENVVNLGKKFSIDSNSFKTNSDVSRVKSCTRSKEETIQRAKNLLKSQKDYFEREMYRLDRIVELNNIKTENEPGVIPKTLDEVYEILKGVKEEEQPRIDKLLDSLNDTLDETKLTISEVKTTIEPIRGLIDSFSGLEKPLKIGLILFGALLVLDLLAAFIVLVKIAIWG